MKTNSIKRIDFKTIKSSKESVMLFGMVVFIVILFITLFSYNNLKILTEKNIKLNEEVTILKNRRDNILVNLKTLNENGKFEDYNQVLGMLVPENEDFFSIIYTLQKLSQESGLIIDEYAVALGRSNAEKTSITIAYINDQTSFMKFLDLYQFSGGRLVSIPKIAWKSDSTGKAKIILNFYTKAFVPLNEQIFKISKVEQNRIKDILFKIKLNTTTPDATPEADVQYETKDNPFE